MISTLEIIKKITETLNFMLLTDTWVLSNVRARAFSLGIPLQGSHANDSITIDKEIMSFISLKMVQFKDYVGP